MHVQLKQVSCTSGMHYTFFSIIVYSILLFKCWLHPPKLFHNPLISWKSLKSEKGVGDSWSSAGAKCVQLRRRRAPIKFEQKSMSNLENVGKVWEDLFLWFQRSPCKETEHHCGEVSKIHILILTLVLHQHYRHMCGSNIWHRCLYGGWHWNT